MNYTEKYHLPQWEETDRVMRTDFNQMCAGIENGLANAQSTADQGLAKANGLPYVVGTYIGNGGTMTIEVGFHPSFVIISGTIGGNSAGSMYQSYYQCCQTSGENIKNSIQFTDTGFIVNPTVSVEMCPQLSVASRPYEYIAFK